MWSAVKEVLGALWIGVIVAVPLGLAIVFGYTLGYDKCDQAWVKKNNEILLMAKEAQDAEIAKREALLAESRRAESSYRARADRLSKQVAALNSRAKSDLARACARCADLARRQEEALERAGRGFDYLGGVSGR